MSFINCNFKDLNSQISGAGIYYRGNLFHQSNGSAAFTDCTFENNSLSSDNGADLRGGVYYLESGSLDFTRCIFNNNSISGTNSNVKGGLFYSESGVITIDSSSFYNSYSSGYGSVAYLESGAEITFLNSIIDSSASELSGGSIHSAGPVSLINTTIGSSSSGSDGGSIYSTSSLSLDNTTIESSSSGSNGGAIYSTGTIDLASSTLDFNTANSDGGAIYLQGSVYADSSQINSNSSGSLGGAIYLQGLAELSNVEINNNSSTGSGGGIWANGDILMDHSYVDMNETDNNGAGIYGNGDLSISFSNLDDNTALNDGGGLWWGSGQVTIERTQIRRNHASRGGGTFILAANPIFQFDEISSNNAVTIGGGLYISKQSEASSTPIIFNSTVVYNTSAVLGSGLLCTYLTNPVVQNPIFWGNMAADGVQMHLQGGSEIFVTFSDIAGGSSGIVGFDDIIFQNNIDEYPDFVDIENENYSLLVTSPSIDRGNPNAPLDPDGTIADIGAYYFDQEINIPGCMDQSAQNFDPEANIDLWCIYGPSFLSIYDVPDDQGGYVFLNWNANSLDILPETVITHYSVWRYVSNERGWEYLGDSPAEYESDYSFTAPTVGISIENPDTTNIKLTEYKIKAHTSDPAVFYESEISTGYSLDNIAPSIYNFSASDEGSEIMLSWDYDIDPDFYNDMIMT